jgi:hypothetical protein
MKRDEEELTKFTLLTRGISGSRYSERKEARAEAEKKVDVRAM